MKSTRIIIAAVIIFALAVIAALVLLIIATNPVLSYDPFRDCDKREPYNPFEDCDGKTKVPGLSEQEQKRWDDAYPMARGRLAWLVVYHFETKNS